MYALMLVLVGPQSIQRWKALAKPPLVLALLVVQQYLVHLSLVEYWKALEVIEPELLVAEMPVVELL